MSAAVQRPPMPLPLPPPQVEQVHEEGSCDILKHIAIATVAAAAFALLATTAVGAVVLSGFMFSILLPVEGVIYLVIGVAALVIAAIAAESAICNSIEAFNLAYPPLDPEFDIPGVYSDAEDGLPQPA
jgi:hypothetical protein